MKYIKRGYIRDVEYMRVDSQDGGILKGCSVIFNKDETKVISIFSERWMHLESVKYLVSEITEKEFNEKKKFAIEYLKQL